MLTRTLRRALLDPRYTLPPTFLLPWSAGLTTAAAQADASAALPAIPTATSISTQKQSSTPSSLSKSQSTKKPTKLSTSVRELLPLLKAQGQIYINVHIYGKAYLLTQGDTLRLPFLMKDVEPGDVLRLDRALLLGSRDFTLKASAGAVPLESPMVITVNSHGEEKVREPQTSPSGKVASAPHYIPNLMKDKYSYLDDKFFVCRALVMGVESEPLRIKEKTKRRQRHVRHVKSKHRYTILKIKELSVRSVEEIESDEVE